MRNLLIALLLIAGTANADVQWSKGFDINCTNATERENGTALAASEIGSITYYVFKAGVITSSPEHTYMFIGECSLSHIDTKLLSTGRKEIYAKTTDTDGRISTNMSSPAYLVNIIKSNPKPPTGLR